MGLVDKPSFSAGELDPALWERTNLDKYRNGLATARNVCVSKTGSLLSRPGRQYFAQTKLPNRSVLCYCPPGGGVLMEWGHLYVRIYSLATRALLYDLPHAFLESDLPNLHFDTSGSYVYVFCAGKTLLKINYANGTFVLESIIFEIPPAPYQIALTPGGSPAGYNIEYGVTYVLNGEESAFFTVPNSTPLPIATGESILVQAQLVPLTPAPGITQMNVYRRPAGAGAFGFVGSTTEIQAGAGYTYASFVDVGADADFTHQPPLSIMTLAADPGTLLSPTGIVYQQRLLLTDGVTDLQAIYASQPGYQDNFFRNFPLDAASALKFKAGTSGYARVLRMLDSDGLVVFTSAGIYLNQGDLTPDNLSLVKKGKWIINAGIPPLGVPGGTFFVDVATNGVRNLLWSFQLNAYDAEEVSIYANHLFRSKQISTWNFQQGYFPLMWVVFSDGTAAAFTFDYNQQMQAWTRHDGALTMRSSAGTTNPDQTFFVVSKIDNQGNTIRYIEVTIPRYVPPVDITTDPDWDKNPSVAYMDGITSFNGLLTLNVPDVFTINPATRTPDGNPDWTGTMNINSGRTPIFTGTIVVGSVLRFFDENGSAIDLKITSISDPTDCVATHNVDSFPQNWTTGARLYQTSGTFTGLNYMAGENPAIIVDGAVVCSPNNDVDNYPVATVDVNGNLTLPGGKLGAIVHVGRPIVGDVQTLAIDTVEQSPTLIESITVNKLYMKVKDTKGLFIGSKFPAGNSVEGMDQLVNYPIDYTLDTPIIGNRVFPSQTRRYEITMAGDFSTQGEICVRQVDPLHFEILSFIPDVEVEKRSDR